MVRAFTAELCKLIMYCDYSTAEQDERLKENLIINMYSSEIFKKVIALSNDTKLKDVIKHMEALKQAAHESKILSENVSGRTPPRSAQLQAMHCY